MANIVTDAVYAIPTAKSTFVSRPDVPADKKITPPDWNQVAVEALTSFRAHLRGAPWMALVQQASDPAPSGIDDYIWVSNTGAPFLHIGGVGGVDYPLLGSFGSNEFGDGLDGDAVLDGAATVLGMVPVANVYTMTRDLFFDDLTISNGVTLKPAGYRIFVKGTLLGPTTGSASINVNGGNALLDVAGAAGGGTGVLGGGTAGGTGGNDGGGAAGSGTNVSNANPRGTNNSTFLGGAAIPSAGTAGNVLFRGGGGGRGQLGAAGDAGQILGTPAAAVGRGTSADFIRGRAITSDGSSALSPRWQGGSGGGGGGGANGGGIEGGGGGGGGGVLVLCAHTIIGNLTIQAKGGDAAAGTGAGSAGGGGGGGGWMCLIYGTKPASATVSVAGGAAGATGGTGGAAGGAGADGLAFMYNVSGDGT